MIVGYAGAYQFQRTPPAVGGRLPNPTLMAKIVWSSSTVGPLSFVGVFDLINGVAAVITQPNPLASIAERSDPATDHIRDAGILGGELDSIRSDHEMFADRERGSGVIREGVFDAVVELPAGQVHRAHTPIHDLDEL
jgi:hypothetical protein